MHVCKNARIPARGSQPQAHCKPFSTSAGSHEPLALAPQVPDAMSRQLSSKQTRGYSTLTANTSKQQAPRRQYCAQPVVAASLCSYLTGAKPNPISDHSIYLPMGCCIPLTPPSHTLSLAPYVQAAHAHPTCQVAILLCPSFDAAHAQPTLIM